MNAVGKKKTLRRKATKRLAPATRATSLEKTDRPSAKEPQIVDFEQTFTDRWEW